MDHASADQQAQQQPSLLQHTRQDTESLSAGSSQLSVAAASAAESQHMQLAGNDGEQLQQQHKQRLRQQQQLQQVASQSGAGCVHGPEVVGETISRLAEAECGPSSFMQRLQDFKRGTDALRRQVHAS